MTCQSYRAGRGVRAACVTDGDNRVHVVICCLVKCLGNIVETDHG